MNCFNHAGIPSVILCLGCLKGLYQNCGQKFDCGVVCSDNYQKVVWEREKINDIAKKIYNIQDGEVVRKRPVVPVLLIILGLGILSLGFYNYIEYSDFSSNDFVLLSSGLWLFIAGSFYLRRYRKLGFGLF